MSDTEVNGELTEEVRSKLQKMRIQGGHLDRPGRTEPPRARARAGGRETKEVFTFGEPEL